jgi:hypothetical protein
LRERIKAAPGCIERLRPLITEFYSAGRPELAEPGFQESFCRLAAGIPAGMTENSPKVDRGGELNKISVPLFFWFVAPLFSWDLSRPCGTRLIRPICSPNVEGRVAQISIFSDSIE